MSSWEWGCSETPPQGTQNCSSPASVHQLQEGNRNQNRNGAPQLFQNPDSLLRSWSTFPAGFDLRARCQVGVTAVPSSVSVSELSHLSCQVQLWEQRGELTCRVGAGTGLSVPPSSPEHGCTRLWPLHPASSPLFGAQAGDCPCSP